jgi:hypothetical protein
MILQERVEKGLLAMRRKLEGGSGWENDQLLQPKF